MKVSRHGGWWLGAVLTIVVATPVNRKPLIQVVAIPGQPLPVVVAMSHGMFERQGIQVRIRVARSSGELRSALATGQADLAHAAVDNAVAMADSGKDVAIVLGGERSLNELIAQPTIHSISGLRGRTLLVDAPTTAFALQLIYILRSRGLVANRDYMLKPAGTTPQRFAEMEKDDHYAATILGPPWSILAKHAGFTSLGTTERYIGPYQSIGAFTRRNWARKHSATVERYLAAYIEGQRWLLDPSHKAEVIALLRQHWHLEQWAAKETYNRMTKNHEWYENDAALDVEGFRNVLRLRATVEGDWNGHPPVAQKYLDLSYYRAALSILKATH